MAATTTAGSPTIISKSVSSHEGSIIAVLCDNAAKKLPKYAKQINTIKPFAVKAGDAVDNIYPYAVKVFNSGEAGYSKFRQYIPDEATPLIFGFVICFFGGSYMTLIAATECVRQVIWERMYKAFKVLITQYNTAYEASLKDDQVDDNNDGIPDVKQITGEELLTRKVYLFFRTVDPNQVSEASTTVWTCTLSVVATLRIQFAQSVTLGSALGEILHSNLKTKVDPFVESALPADMKAWAPVSVEYGFRAIGCVVAWWMARLIAAFHAAVRGADMCVKHGLVLMKEKGYLAASINEDSPQVAAFIALVAFLGFYWQLSNGFGIPFPLNLLLLPATIAEYMLSSAVFFFGGFTGGAATTTA